MKPIFTLQKSELDTSLESIEKLKAEKRLKATQFKPGNIAKSQPDQHTRLLHRSSSREGHHPNQDTISKNKYPPGKGSLYEIAKRIAMSHSTYERSKIIIEKGNEAIKG